MNTLLLVWKNMTQQWGVALLSMILTAFGVAILTAIYISSDTFEKQLSNNSRHIDLVVGAKGSPLQLILSTLYHIDNPTGNISLQEANTIAQNPLIQTATPISLGDNYKGHRIIGTDSSFLSLYDLTLSEGKVWKKSFEVIIGSEVAKKHSLHIGQQIHSAHGLSADAHIHNDHPFTIVGIINRSNSVVDNLILCNLASVWDVHGIHHDGEHIHGPDCDHTHDEDETHQHSHSHDHTHKEAHTHDDEQERNEHDHHHAEGDHTHEELVTEKPQEESLIKYIGQDMIEDHGLEITALLVRYASPTAISIIPRMINQDTQMQAASPAIESSRIFSLLGAGLDSLSILAYIIMGIAGLSIFISLYNALKERKYDMAIMRTMGATKTKLFSLVIVEGILITAIGGILGLLFGHMALYFISTQTSQSANFVEAFRFYPNEIWILIAAVALGIIAALIPAFKAYKTTISNILASK